MDKKAIIKALRDFGQSASNTAADTVAVPVDLIAAGLRSGGLPIPSNPVGGSEWMTQKGLKVPVDPGMAKTAGEAAGILMPMVAAAKAPQIAAGLNQMGANAAKAGMKGPISRQRGAIDISTLEAMNPNVEFVITQSPSGKATLAKVVVPNDQRNSGIGTKFMSDLSRMADDSGALLTLNPSSDFGGTKSRLVDFYKRFGFVENKGKAKDYAVSEMMYREPM